MKIIVLIIDPRRDKKYRLLGRTMSIFLSSVDWKLIITTIIAVYGASLATTNLINSLKNNKSFEVVEISWGLIANIGDDIFQAVISIMNPSNKAITLSLVCFELPNKSHIIIPRLNSNVTFPYELQRGKS